MRALADSRAAIVHCLTLLPAPAGTPTLVSGHLARVLAVFCVFLHALVRAFGATGTIFFPCLAACERTRCLTIRIGGRHGTTLLRTTLEHVLLPCAAFFLALVMAAVALQACSAASLLSPSSSSDALVRILIAICACLIGTLALDPSAATSRNNISMLCVNLSVTHSRAASQHVLRILIESILFLAMAPTLVATFFTSGAFILSEVS